MDNTTDLIIVKARVRFKTTTEGGRIGPVKSGYRPNHVFEKPDNPELFQTYIGDIQFDDQEFIQLGETKIVTVRFLRTDKLEKFIKVGQKWFIYEVPKLVAEGEIIEV